MSEFTTDILPDCPCVKCVCLAICRLKFYGTLFLECSIVQDYLTQSYDQDANHRFEHRVALKVALNPIAWDLTSEGFTIDKKDIK